MRPHLPTLAAAVVLPALFLPAFAAPDEAGRTVFLDQAEPRCGVCHTLADAGTTGEVGPNLDLLKPDAERVKAAVTNGIGVMPAFEDLSPDQIEAVARYVSGAASRK
ncbi:c-type cytochrome [Methylobacterium dankookense]|uniref:Cytochrome c6 n=1 Tax=Methylobacterium dankookense TaxID=560405 RepID=A0A564FWE6_9HYPH|nr:c-type cytochrome [Methylobacterium dankookense]GJD58374.1 Cytochrome c6 [Methylobacterium dankookense]VUF12327.1 Cytochrome c6 [Methylobacterium dankookense]